MEMVGTHLAFHRFVSEDRLESNIRFFKEKGLGAIEFGWNLCTIGFPGQVSNKNGRKKLLFPSELQISGVLEKTTSMRRSIHAPYTISLTTNIKKVLTTSKRYITHLARLGDLLQASHFTFHAGAGTPDAAKRLTKVLIQIIEKFDRHSVKILPSIELAGKNGNFGSFFEVLKVANDVGCLFTWDFAHDYARGGNITSEKGILARLEETDNSSLDLKTHYLPIHISGIVGGRLGEKHHTSLEKSDIPWEMFLSVLGEQKYLEKVTLICESKSQNLEDEERIINFIKSGKTVKEWFPKKSRLEAYF